MNAIILAAGVGHRMYQLTRSKNKVFLSIGGITMIEKIILYLKDAMIDDISIVTGHCHDLFKPLVQQYQVKLIYNRYYSIYNNLYSIKLMADKINDTFIIHGDVALFKNIFQQIPEESIIYAVCHNSKGIPQRHLILDDNNKVNHIEECAKDADILTFLGMYYFKDEEARKIRTYLKDDLTLKKMKQYYGQWEDILLAALPEHKMRVLTLDKVYGLDVNNEKDYFHAVQLYESYWRYKNIEK